MVLSFSSSEGEPRQRFTGSDDRESEVRGIREEVEEMARMVGSWDLLVRSSGGLR